MLLQFARVQRAVPARQFYLDELGLRATVVLDTAAWWRVPALDGSTAA